VTEKRLFDILLAAVVVVVAAPVMAVLAVVVKLDSPGPVFYRAERVGLDGRPFRLLKLRTMVAGADRIGPPVTAGGDPRVTRAGQWLRRLKVDEIPQFVNVLVGDMSIVGPRPEHPEFVAHYTSAQRRVLSIKPGITSLASLRYSDEESLLGGDASRVYLEKVMPAKLALDLEYLEERSFRGDLEVILRTAKLIASRVI
jgi:lipopolysaccharide/colanic/teichoic acid biosynthesis glycosyltransferase